MGGGSYDHSVYTSTRATNAAAGVDDFAYSGATIRSGTYTVHEDLDVSAGVIRESRDSDEHPNSSPIGVVLDVTGSMSTVPRRVLDKFPQLFGLLLRKGYVTDPQLLFGAIGDGFSDRVPVQLGQFESDNRIDETLTKIILEGGGGGGNHESYELLLKFFADHVVTDAWDKRKRKGYLFIVGDEKAYTQTTADQLKKLLGEDEPVPEDIATLTRRVQERWHVYFIHPQDASYQDNPENIGFWTTLLGQNYIRGVAVNEVPETIAMCVGIEEGVVDLTDIGSHLNEVGSDADASRLSTALAPIASSKVAVASSSGSLPEVPGDSGSVSRL